MGFVLFHYTLFVLLGSILTSATCLSAYLVSRKRTMLYASFGFLFYFFDVAWVFNEISSPVPMPELGLRMR